MSLTDPAMLMIIGKYFSKRRALAYGVLTAGDSVGVLALGPLYNYLIETFGVNGKKFSFCHYRYF